jgi:hypothetical protein
MIKTGFDLSRTFDLGYIRAELTAEYLISKAGQMYHIRNNRIDLINCTLRLFWI